MPRDAAIKDTTKWILKHNEAQAYDALDPDGNITIKWDIVSWTRDDYVKRMMHLTQMETSIKWDIISWTPDDYVKEVIWSMMGTQTSDKKTVLDIRMHHYIAANGSKVFTLYSYIGDRVMRVELVFHVAGMYSSGPAAGVWCDTKSVVTTPQTGRYSADAAGGDAAVELTRRFRHAAAAFGDFIFIYGGLRGGFSDMASKKNECILPRWTTATKGTGLESHALDGQTKHVMSQPLSSQYVNATIAMIPEVPIASSHVKHQVQGHSNQQMLTSGNDSIQNVHDIYLTVTRNLFNGSNIQSNGQVQGGPQAKNNVNALPASLPELSQQGQLPQLYTFDLTHNADEFERLLKEMCAEEDGDLLIDSAYPAGTLEAPSTISETLAVGGISNIN
ncbi:Serine/threonine-protein phosphatase [Artemisia annua]|uniref:Serine/threonine-protein phosphatase n=1 Tax=Artemisia annua TaxID=35608 RepID=A0A2U1NQT7_ARTAN|nr:Serine/threonine-protein phosphatase [Artemisia annua]